jgi:nucleoside phosphorylase
MQVAAAWIGEMGEAAAAARAAALVNELDPACLAMCGICAGKRGEVSLGDVIVADRVYSYDHGKLVARDEGGSGEFFHDIETYSLNKAWKMDASIFARDLAWAADLIASRPIARRTQMRWALHALFAHETRGAPSPLTHPERKARCPAWSDVLPLLRSEGLVEVQRGSLLLTERGRERVLEDLLHYPDGMPDDPPFRVHVGPIATGKVVREDPAIFDRLARLVRKTLGVEMEAAAIGQVAMHLGRPSIIVKAVSDHADHDKDDVFRAFACRASAAWLFAFLARHLEPTPELPAARQVIVGGGVAFFDGGAFHEGGALPSGRAPYRAPQESEPHVRALAVQLDEAFARRKRLREAGAPTAAVDAEILALRRQMREGGVLRAGDSLGDGRYLLLDQVGRGGFAYVWRALDREAGEEVAIKVLRSDLAADTTRLDRFFRGARIMAELSHPAVVRVRSQKEEDGGYQYFVMEFVPGGDLRHAVLSGSVKGEAALPLILTVGDALAAAHAQKIIHRDVKPANILLDAAGAPRLTDFDLVAVKDTTGGTRTGAMGTFGYAAPECMHHPQDADARADVFGLSMTAIFALHGRELPLDVVRDARGFIRKLACSEAIKAVLERGAAWDAEARFSDASAFCAALRQALASPLVDEDDEDRDAGPSTIRSPGLPAEMLDTSPDTTNFLRWAERAVAEHPDGVLAVAFDPEGRLVAAGHRDGTTRVWDVSTGDCVHALWGGSASIVGLSFALKRALVSSLSADGRITSWDLKTGDLLHHVGFRGVAATSVAFRADGALLAAGCSDGTVRVVSLEPDEPTDRSILSWDAGRRGRIVLVAFAPDEHTLVCCSAGGEIKKISSPFANVAQRDAKVAVSSAALSADGRWLSLGTADGQVILLPMAEFPHSVPWQLDAHDGEVPGVAFLRAERALAWGDRELGWPALCSIENGPEGGLLRLWSVPEGVVLREQRDLPPLDSIAASPDGKLVACGAAGGALLLVDSTTGAVLRTLHPSR